MDTLPRLFLATSEQFGPEVALREKDYGIWQEVTWADYRRHVQLFAQGLAALGLERGDVVCIHSENCQEWLYSDLGAQAAGGVVVGVYPTSPADEVRYIAAHSDARFYVAEDQEELDKVLAVHKDLPLLRRIIVFDMNGVRRYGHPLVISFKEVQALGDTYGREHPRWFAEAVASTTGDDLSVIIYTSGTTGPPKGALISHRNVLDTTAALLQVHALTRDDTILSYLPLCHAIERIFSLYIPLHTGGVVNFAESLETVPQNLVEIAPTVFMAVPRIWEKLKATIEVRIEESTRLKRAVFRWAMREAERRARRHLTDAPGFPDRARDALLWLLVLRATTDKLGLRRARLAFCGGAPISVDVLIFFKALGIPIRELYGMTEVTNIFTSNYGTQIRLGTVGQPYPGYEIRIAEDGEILLRGPGVFQGYYKDPAATAAILVDGWVRSGDLGRLDATGSLVITGRKKDIFITRGGKNISPQLIENALKTSPYIKEAMVIGDGRRYLTALFELDLEMASSWCQTHGIPYTNLRDLARNPAVADLIAGEVARANASLSRVEQIKRFRLLEKDLDHEDGEVTATQKVRRLVMADKFRDLIESMYGDGDPEDGRTGGTS